MLTTLQEDLRSQAIYTLKIATATFTAATLHKDMETNPRKLRFWNLMLPIIDLIPNIF